MLVKAVVSLSILIRLFLVDCHNLTDWVEHRRQKRYLIFENGGIDKFVIGFSYPVNLGDVRPWRQLNSAYNFQSQYNPPTKPLYWWDKWQERSIVQARRLYDETGSYVEDQSSKFVYLVFENLWDKRGFDGKACLQRAFCENAQAYDDFSTVITALINRVFTPGDTDDQSYRDAYKAGQLGLDCVKQYKDCPPGNGIFDGGFMTSLYEDF